MLDQNYFSEAPKTLISEIDLSDYLLEGGLGDISFASTQIDENNSQYTEAGSVNLSLANTITGFGNLRDYLASRGQKLTDFFELTNLENAFLFVVEIRETSTNEKLFVGVIERSQISLRKRPDEILNITATSLDKQFAEYYSNQELDSFDTFPVSNMGQTINNLQGLKFTRLLELFYYSMPNVTLAAAGGGTMLDDYFVASRAYLYAEIPTTVIRNTRTLILQSGYENFYLSKISKYEYLNSICLSMGWKWFFKADVLYIQRRYEGTQTLSTLDYNTDIMDHGLQITNNDTIKNVIIDNGEFYDNQKTVISSTDTACNVRINSFNGYIVNRYYLGGFNYKIYSEAITNNNRNLPYNEIVNTGSIYQKSHGGEDTTVFISDEQLDKKIRMKVINNVNFLMDLNLTYDVYDETNTIFLKPFIPSSDNSAHCDFTQARTTGNQFYGDGNAYNLAQDPGVNGLFFRGNPGSGLLKRASDGVYEGYHYYTSLTGSGEFWDNMKTLTGSKNKLVLNVTINGINTNIGGLYKVTNYPYHNLNDNEFIVDELSIDILNNQTNLKLISLNE